MMPPEPPHFDPTRAALGGRSCTWLHVADGDTLRVQGSTLITVEDRVRLLGIDAPERGEDGWGAAREYLAGLVRGHGLVLEGVSPGVLTRGRCNRILAHVWADGVHVGWAMCLAGWSRSAHDWGVGHWTEHLDQAAAWAVWAGLPRS